MRHSKPEFKQAVISGEPDQVNSVIEEVKNAGTAECAQLFVSCIEEFAECYYVDDGYQRLSAIRFLRDLYVPHIPVTYRDAFWELLLDAVQDDDGRVRKATVKAIDKVLTFTSYLDQPVEPLQDDLTEIAAQHTGKTRNDIDQVIRSAKKYSVDRF